MRDSPKLNGNLCRPLRHPFPSTQIKRCSSPTPVVDIGLDRDVCFAQRVLVDVRFISIRHDMFTVDPTFGILTAHRVLKCMLRLDRADSAEKLHFLVAHCLWLEV